MSLTRDGMEPTIHWEEAVFELTEEIIESVIFAMEDQDLESLIDLETGEVYPLEFEPLEEENKQEREGGGIEAPIWSSRDGFRLMESFLGTVRRPSARSDLSAALAVEGYSRHLRKPWAITLKWSAHFAIIRKPRWEGGFESGMTSFERRKVSSGSGRNRRIWVISLSAILEYASVPRKSSFPLFCLFSKKQSQRLSNTCPRFLLNMERR